MGLPTTRGTPIQLDLDSHAPLKSIPVALSRLVEHCLSRPHCCWGGQRFCDQRSHLKLRGPLMLLLSEEGWVFGIYWNHPDPLLSWLAMMLVWRLCRAKQTTSSRVLFWVSLWIVVACAVMKRGTGVVCCCSYCLDAVWADIPCAVAGAASDDPAHLVPSQDHQNCSLSAILICTFPRSWERTFAPMVDQTWVPPTLSPLLEHIKRRRATVGGVDMHSVTMTNLEEVFVCGARVQCSWSCKCVVQRCKCTHTMSTI